MKAKLAVLFSFFAIHTQAQLVFNNGGYLVMNGGTSGSPLFTVLGGTAIPATPITVSASGGIIAEKEFHKLRYPLGTNTTAINVPFLRGATLTNKVDVGLAVIVGGIGAGGVIDFSNVAATTTATGWDNNTYKPSMVTHMSQSTAPGTNGSDYAIDRFWLVNASGYSAKPSINLTFTYLDDEWATNTGNTITETNLQAQRFNTTSNIWGDYLSGTVNTVTNTVTATVALLDFYTAWTLTDRTNPLPIKLKTISATCANATIQLHWITATETNNNYFTIEKSTNGILFEPIATIAGAGNSSIDKEYTYTDINTLASQTYYRLKQTDYDGNYEYSDVFSANCVANFSAFEFNKANVNNDGTIVLAVNTAQEETKNVVFTDVLGQTLYNVPHTFSQGYNQITLSTVYLAKGIYFITLTNATGTYTKKIIIQ